MHPGAGWCTNGRPPCWDPTQLRAELGRLLEQGLSRREAARHLAEHSGHSRRELYALLHEDAGDAEDNLGQRPE